MRKKVYVGLMNWASEGESGAELFGVFTDYARAKEALTERAAEDIRENWSEYLNTDGTLKAEEDAEQFEYLDITDEYYDICLDGANYAYIAIVEQELI